MHFQKIDIESWDRKEYFVHYLSAVPCTYSMTVKLDITSLVTSGKKLYPAMLYLLTKTVNRHREFRTAFNEKGELGYYDQMIPCYTVFHKDTELFSTLWTPCSDDYALFCKAYREDLEQYGSINRMAPKPGIPPNHFNVSMIPWESFDGFHLNLQKGYDYLLPIFTMGRYSEENGKYILPLSIQVHHAVCDGYPVCRFVSELRELLSSPL